jgi:hypothetical protein
MNPNIKPPPYPIDKFYLLIGEAANEVKMNTQAPDALVAMEFLATMSVAAQALYVVRLPTGQIKPVSLNLCAIAESGERKTGVHNLVSRPLYESDKVRMEKYAADLKRYQQEMHVWKAIDVGLRRELSKQTQQKESTADLCRDLVDHVAKMPEKPRARRLMRQNATERAIMDALEGDGESIGFISDEGEIIVRGGALSKTGVLNKAWDGAAMLSLDRSDGESVIVRNPRVTTWYMIQPQVLKDFLDRRGEALRSSGHWARYLMGFPESTQGNRYVRSLDMQWSKLQKFHERAQELLDDFGARVDEGLAQPKVLEFSYDAIPRWIGATNQIEGLLRESEYFHDIKDAASKMLENVARVAALLHIFSSQEGAISVESFERAMTIVTWHIDEFKRLFSSQAVVPQHVADAQSLEHYLYWNYWCAAQQSAPKNEVLRNGPVRPSSRFEAALNQLLANYSVFITIGPKRTRFINLQAAHFGAMSHDPQLMSAGFSGSSSATGGAFNLVRAAGNW